MNKTLEEMRAETDAYIRRIGQLCEEITYKMNVISRKIKESKEVLSEDQLIERESNKYCQCTKPQVEPITKDVQHGGEIKEIIVGYECGRCDHEIDPDTMPTKEQLDYELYGNE